MCPTIEQLAEDMCNDDNAMADACAETAEQAAKYPDWRNSSEARREHFRQKAREALG